MNKLPIVTVTCHRDLALLDLQAQSIQQHLIDPHDIYIVVNEDDPSKWLESFNQYIRFRYARHRLTIVYRQEFDIGWKEWIPSPRLNWSMGWEQQQILKLVIATRIDSIGYLVLDSQNFLIKPASSETIEQDRIPYRQGQFVMPVSTWQAYTRELNVTTQPPSERTMSISTPIYLHTSVVKSLLDHKDSLTEFARWFKSIPGKSEFILYLIYTERLGGIDKFHYVQPDWGNPMLRDSPSFDEDFEKFLYFIGEVPSHVWVSANHRSWGDMTQEQYTRLCSKLGQYNLTPNFDQYRKDFLEKYR